MTKDRPTSSRNETSSASRQNDDADEPGSQNVGTPVASSAGNRHKKGTEVNTHPSNSEQGQETAESEVTLPPAVVDEAERLTKRARNAGDENERQAYRAARDRKLAEYGYRARIRDDKRAILVLYPEEWVEDGTIRLERIESIDRGIECPLDGVGDGSWEAVESHNSDIVARVRSDHGSDHGANVRALADFAGNHYLKPIDELSGAELSRFLEEYYPRNVWPSEEQRAIVETSIELAFESCDDADLPNWKS